jgi:hypothetical protein
MMLGLGPHIIIDKSVLEMLSGDEFSLLTEYFQLVVPPVLIEEIVADLALKPKERRLPEDVVRRLARRMAEAVGYESVHYVQAVGGNLLGHDVPMFGQVPIGGRPNAFSTEDGDGFIYDQVPEQQFWQRLAAGEFDSSDAERAKAWRRDIAHIDLEALQRNWSPIAKTHFFDDVLLGVDKAMENADDTVQENLIKGAVACIGFSDVAEKVVLTRWERMSRPKFRSFAPYAAYVTRLFMTFAAGVSSSVITTRSTNLIDLQYLCYVPFCSVFSSGDRFHETMWPAAAGRNSFVRGAELKADLRRRHQRRSTGADTRRIHPSRSDGSVITRMHDLYGIPESQSSKSPERKQEGKIQTIEDLDPETQERLKRAFEEMNQARDARGERASFFSGLAGLRCLNLLAGLYGTTEVVPFPYYNPHNLR